MRDTLGSLAAHMRWADERVLKSLERVHAVATDISPVGVRIAAGERDSRQLTDYLDSLGLQRSSSVGVHHTRFGAAALAPVTLPEKLMLKSASLGDASAASNTLAGLISR